MQKAGGANALLRCGNGSVMTEGFQVPMVAWTLGVRTLRVEAPPTKLAPPPWPAVILQTRAQSNSTLLPTPAQIIAWERAGAHYTLLAHVRTFRVFSTCAGKVAQSVAVSAPPRGIPRVLDVREPKLLQRVPTWASTAAILIVLTAISAYLRTKYITGQFWEDEAITTGIASHSLSAIPGVLRHDGSPPLFYLLLHVWISVFGASEAATHSLSLVFGLLCIPAGMWAGWSLFGRRAGVYAAVLFAFSTFLTAYAQETRMYELMALLGILETAAFIHAFVYRRRRYLILFAVCQALMLYTHGWGIFFGVGTVLALIPIWRVSDDRRGIVRDAVIAYVGAGVLFLPWLPNFIYQATHTGAPWAPKIRFGVPVLLSRDLLGSDRITVALLTAMIIGLAPLFTKRYRRSRDGTVMWSLIVLIAGTLIVAWLASQITPGVRRALHGPDPRRDPAAGGLGSCALGRRRAGGDRALGPVRGPPLLLRPAVQERHARHQRRDDAAPAPERPRAGRAARLDAARLVLPARPACSTRPRSGG